MREALTPQLAYRSRADQSSTSSLLGPVGERYYGLVLARAQRHDAQAAAALQESKLEQSGLGAEF